jgi:prevent-host-death family protein
MGGPHGPRVIKASEFKARCLKLMDEVAENGGEIVITKHGRPTARLVAYREKPRTLFGIDRGRLEIVGDLDDSMDVEWDAESAPDRVLNP